MNDELRDYIRKNNYIYSYLREDSYQYKYLYRDRNNIKEIEKRSKEKYSPTSEEKIKQIEEKLSWINAIISALE